MLQSLPELIRTPLAFLVVLGILVFVHELGHYLAARMVGVHVETFSIGFGRALASWTDRQGTLWKLAWLPLGGYVKLHGQEQPADVPPEIRALWQEGRTFHAKPVRARAFVVAAGPLANFVLAAVLFAVLFTTSGRPRTLPVVGIVVEESAAARAGIKAGDEIAAIDGQAMHRFEDIQAKVGANPGRELSLDVVRDGRHITVAATPEGKGAIGHAVGVLGVRGGTVVYERMPVWEAVPAGISQTWEVAAQTLGGVWGMITGARGTDDLGGPLRIAQLSGQVAQLGLVSMISFIAVLSVNLGLINLFPIPVLDGGHLVFYAIEGLIGRPLPPRAVEYGFRAGFALLIGLFVFATWNDLSHFGLFAWVNSLRG